MVKIELSERRGLRSYLQPLPGGRNFSPSCCFWRGPTRSR